MTCRRARGSSAAAFEPAVAAAVQPGIHDAPLPVTGVFRAGGVSDSPALAIRCPPPSNSAMRFTSSTAETASRTMRWMRSRSAGIPCLAVALQAETQLGAAADQANLVAPAFEHLVEIVDFGLGQRVELSLGDAPQHVLRGLVSERSQQEHVAEGECDQTRRRAWCGNPRSEEPSWGSLRIPTAGNPLGFPQREQQPDLGAARRKSPHGALSRLSRPASAAGSRRAGRRRPRRRPPAGRPPPGARRPRPTAARTPRGGSRSRAVGRRRAGRRSC